MFQRGMRGGVLAAFLLLAGCAGQGKVSGTVKFAGQVLAGGTITFYDSRNMTQSSPIGEDGSYSISRVAVGPVKVSIAVPISIPIQGTLPGAQTTVTTTKTPAIPTRYNDPKESGLGFEVTRGNQTKDFDLVP
jgi:hypothetical protein